jgi:phage shock protein B
LDDQEAKMIQEIYHGLTKMEERVEALETLLLEKEKKDG